MRRGNVILAIKAACFLSILYSAHGDWDDDLRLAVTFHKQYNHPRARELIEELAKDIEIRKKVTTWLVNLPNMPWFWQGSNQMSGISLPRSQRPQPKNSRCHTIQVDEALVLLNRKDRDEIGARGILSSAMYTAIVHMDPEILFQVSTACVRAEAHNEALKGNAPIQYHGVRS